MTEREPLPAPELEIVELDGQFSFINAIEEVKKKRKGFERNRTPTPLSRAELYKPEMIRFNTLHFTLPEIESSHLDAFFLKALVPYSAKKSDWPKRIRTRAPRTREPEPGELDYRYVPTETIVSGRGEKRKRIFVEGFDARIQEGYYSDNHIIGIASLASPRPLNIFEMVQKNKERIVVRHWPTTMNFSVSSWVRPRDKMLHENDKAKLQTQEQMFTEYDDLLWFLFVLWDSRRAFNTYDVEGKENLYFFTEMLQGRKGPSQEMPPRLAAKQMVQVTIDKENGVG